MEINGNIYRAYFGKGMRTIFQKKDKKKEKYLKYMKKTDVLHKALLLYF